MKKIFLFLILLLSHYSWAQNSEVKLLNYLNTPKQQPNADYFFKGLSNSSYPISFIVPTTVFTIGLLKNNKETRIKAIHLAGGLGLSMSISILLKYTIDRQRPFEKYSFIVPKINKDSPSFPSGHTSTAFETATVLSLYYPKWYVIVPAYMWAGGIGYSRMYLGIHYPSDIVASILIGSGSAWLTWKIQQNKSKRKTKK